MIRLTCITCLFLLIAAATFSQPRYTIQHLTNERGLPGNSVMGMEWDREHQLLWIGTNAGIAKWNGQHLTSENKGEGRIIHMCSHRQNGQTSIYATTEWGYIHKLVNTTFESEGFHPDNQLLIAYNIAIDNNSPDKIFRDIDKKTNKWVLPSMVVPLDTGFHNLLVHFQKDIFLRWNGRINRITRVKNDGFFFRGKEIWLIDGHEVRIFNPLTRTFGNPVTLSGATSLPVDYTIIPDVNSDLPFIFGGGRLYRIRRAGEKLDMTLLTDKLPKRLNIKTIRLLEGTGCITIGDFTAGIYLLRPTSVLPVGAVPSTSDLPSVVTYGQALMPNGGILTRGQALISKSGVQYNKAPLDADFCVYSTGPFIYSAKGAFAYQYNRLTRKTKKYALLYRALSAVYATTEGRSYLITQAGIYELLEDTVKPVYMMPPGPDGLRLWLTCNSAAEFRKGVIAIGGDARLTLYNTRSRQLDTIPTVKNAPIRALWRQGDYFFMGTYGKGIFVLKNGRISALPLDKQEYLKYTHCFRPDGKGYLYLSSNNGLFRVSQKAFLAAADHPVPLYYHYLGRKDGLFTTELNGGCEQCAIQLPDGTLSFASMNGLAWLHPDSVTAPAPPGIILVDSVQVDNRKYGAAAPGLKSLPDGTEDVTFHINIPYWGNEENLYCWYRLRNFIGKESNPWIRFNPASLHDFSFSSLKKGDYRFEVALINGYERADIRFLAIPFSIEAPWYLKWYGILLWVVLWLLIIIILIKWRTARVNKRAFLLKQTVDERTAELNVRVAELAVANQLQERMISVVGHNIIAPLRYMHDASSALKEGAQSLSPDIQLKAINSIKETSQEMELLAVNLLNWIRMQHQDYKNLRPEYFRISEVMERVHDILHPLAQERGQELILEAAADKQINQYKDALQVILYNLALNAVLYSGKGQILLSYTEEAGGQLRLSVTDKGKGMSPEKVQELLGNIMQPVDAEERNMGQGFGYMIIKDTLRLIDGSLQIVSEPGAGTVAAITFESLG